MFVPLKFLAGHHLLFSLSKPVKLVGREMVCKFIGLPAPTYSNRIFRFEEFLKNLLDIAFLKEEYIFIDMDRLLW